MNFFLNNSLKTVRYSYFGLPQGSCLSPFLYNIHTCDISRVIPNGCIFYQFADDKVISVSGKNRFVIQHFLQDALNRLVDWASENGFSFSVSKSQFILFSRKHSIVNIQLYLCDREIEIVDTYKYLGIWFDSKLTWKKHID